MHRGSLCPVGLCLAVFAGQFFFSEDGRWISGTGDANAYVFTGEFGANMKVALENDGPVTICMDTKNKE